MARGTTHGIIPGAGVRGTGTRGTHPDGRLAGVGMIHGIHGHGTGVGARRGDGTDPAGDRRLLPEEGSGQAEARLVAPVAIGQ